MATKTLAVKAIYATVFLDNGSHAYVELEQGEDGTVNVVTNTLHRAAGTNDFYAEYQTANQAAAHMAGAFTKGHTS